MYLQIPKIWKTISTFKIKPFVALASDFQPLTNVTKNSMLGVAGTLDPPLERYNIF